LKTISKKTKYGLRALYSLSRKYGSGPILIATLAREEAIPLKFLQAILLELKTHGVVDSKKGLGGGYQLAKPPYQISVGSVVRAMEGPLAPVPCASETAYRPCAECGEVDYCGTRIVMKQVRDAIARILDQTTLADVIRQADSARDRKREVEFLMDHI
jgi:Rrf2 family protein